MKVGRASRRRQPPGHLCRVFPADSGSSRHRWGKRFAAALVDSDGRR